MKLPLVLLPGLLCDAALWEPQLSELADAAWFWVPDLTEYETMKEMGDSFLRLWWPAILRAGGQNNKCAAQQTRGGDQRGFDPGWFGVIIVMAVTLGLVCPPVGMNVFVLNSIARDISLPR